MQPILIQVAGQTAHRCHRAWVVTQRCGVEPERLVTAWCAGHGRDDDLVDPRVDINHVVGQSISIQVVECDGRANRGNPRGDPLQAGMDRPEGASRPSGEIR